MYFSVLQMLTTMHVDIYFRYLSNCLFSKCLCALFVLFSFLSIFPLLPSYLFQVTFV